MSLPRPTLLCFSLENLLLTAKEKEGRFYAYKHHSEQWCAIFKRIDAINTRAQHFGIAQPLHVALVTLSNHKKDRVREGLDHYYKTPEMQFSFKHPSVKYYDKSDHDKLFTYHTYDDRRIVASQRANCSDLLPPVSLEVDGVCGIDHRKSILMESEYPVWQRELSIAAKSDVYLIDCDSENTTSALKSGFKGICLPTLHESVTDMWLRARANITYMAGVTLIHAAIDHVERQVLTLEKSREETAAATLSTLRHTTQKQKLFIPMEHPNKIRHSERRIQPKLPFSALRK